MASACWTRGPPLRRTVLGQRGASVANADGTCHDSGNVPGGASFDEDHSMDDAL